MNSPLARRFADYAAYHRTPGNQLCHLLGIPLIMLSLLGLLSRVTLGTWEAGPYLRLDLGTVLLVLSGTRYLTLDWKLGAPFVLVAFGMYFAGAAFSTSVLWVLFVLGWIFQGVGHAVFEKKSPAFLKNIEHLLIGPLWIFAKLTGNVGAREGGA